jgi:transcriptional regulator with XRE-family HTH domain
MPTYTVDELIRVRLLAASGEARRRRTNAGLSLAEIAADVGVTAGTIWKWETAFQRPRGVPAIRFLAVLDKLGALDEVSA